MFSPFCYKLVANVTLLSSVHIKVHPGESGQAFSRGGKTPNNAISASFTQILRLVHVITYHVILLNPVSKYLIHEEFKKRNDLI